MSAASLGSQRRAPSIKQRKNGHTANAAKITTPTIYPASGIIQRNRYSAWAILPNIAAITPQYLQGILRGALMGFAVAQWELFDLMIDTWPELATCIQELTYGVERKKLIIEPYCDEDEAPTPQAQERSDFISQAFRLMDPNPATDENDLRGTVADLVDAWFRGLTLLELFWQNVDGVGICPRATQWVHPKNYAYDQNYVLGLRDEIYTSTTSVQAVPSNLIPLPPFKFLVGAHKAKAGPALGCALLRPLAWWWCAANFSSDWLLNLAQLFGIPHRSVKYDPNASPETLGQIDQMLQNSGSASWSRWPTGTEIEFISPTKEGSDHTPQGELMDRADRYARSLILGQTMTGTHGSMGKGGGQAFGMVERNVKEDRVDAAGKFVAGVINQQLIKHILNLNYGDTDDAPSIRFLEDEEGGLVEAQRDQILIKSGLPIGVDFMRKKYGIPEPAKDEETLSAPEPSTQLGSSEGSEAGTPTSQNPTDTRQTEDTATDEPPDEDTVANVSRVYAIEDDKIFAAELLKLADQLKGKQ